MQHSQWNHTHHPFILCQCKRGDAVKNIENNTRQIIIDEAQLMHYDKSVTKFAQIYLNTCNRENYKKYCDCADKKL